MTLITWTQEQYGTGVDVCDGQHLVLRHGDNDGFSVPVVFRSKAHRAGNGGSLVKRCNAAAGHHGHALRVSLSAPMDCVAPLGKATSIPGEVRLAMNADKLTASVIITVTEYSNSSIF